MQVKKIPENRMVKLSCPSCKNLFHLDVSGIVAAIPQSGEEKPKDIEKRVPKESASNQANVSASIPSPDEEKIEPKKFKTISGKCPKCGAAFSMPFDKIAVKSAVELQCNSCRNKFRLILPQVKEHLSQMSPMEDDPV